MEINNAQHDTKTEADNNQLTTNATQLARMISLVIKQVKSDQPVQPEQVPNSLKEEESLIFQTLGGHGVSIAEVVQKVVNATEAVTDTDNDELPTELAEKIIQSSRNGTLSLEEIFPALFGDQSDSYSTHVLIDYLDPKTIPLAGFETTYILASPYDRSEFQISHNTDSQIIFPSNQLSADSQQGPNSVNDTDNSSSGFLTTNDDNFTASEDNTLSDSVATNDSTTSGGTLSYAVATDVSNGTLVFNNDGSFDYTPDANFNGDDSFSYTVTDTDSGETATQTVSVTVDPVADLTATDDSFTTNEDSALSDSVASNDSTTSGGTLSYAVATDVSNGTLVFNNDGSFDYTPDANFNGDDSFTYTVTDSDSGETANNSVSLTVTAEADLTATDDSFTTNEDSALSDSVTSNDSTTSGGTLSYAVATDVSNGTLVFNNDGSFDYTPDANFNGDDSFTYTVTDSDSGETANNSVSLTVTAEADLTATDDSFTTNEDSALSDSVASNDSTTSGGTLSYAVATDVSNGTLVFNNDGSFDYTPDANFNGDDSFTYTVTDSDSGETATNSVSLTVTAEADLTATDDSFTTNEDSALSDSVATNDSTTSGGTLSYAVATDVSNGTLVFNNDGSFDYTPDANFNGDDSFTYTVTDADSGETATQTVSVTVDPVADLTATDDSFTTNEDAALSDSVASNDSTTSGGSLSYALETDANNGTLVFNNDGSFEYSPNSGFTGNDAFTYSVTDIESGESTTQAVSISIQVANDLIATDDNYTTNEDIVLNGDVSSNDSTSSGGSLAFVVNTGVSNGSLTLNSNGTFTYTPDTNYNGNDSFTYTVTDSATSETSTQTVSVTVDPVADLTATDDSFTTNEDAALSDSVATNDSTTSGGTLSYAVATDASNGTLVFNNDGSFDYTPDANFNGNDSFSYTVTDADSGETANNSVSLTVTAEADLTATDDSFTTNEDSALSDSVASNDSTTSGGTLSYAVATDASNGTLVFNNDGSFDYTPDANFNGDDSFTYTVTDTDSGETATQTVSVTVDPVADLTATDDSFTTNEDSALSDSVATNDSTTSGGSLSYALETDVSNGTLVFNNDGSFDYTPNSNFNGDDSFTYTVTDSDSGESDTRSVSLTVVGVNDPTAISNESATVTETSLPTQSTFNDNFTVNDIDGDSVSVSLTKPVANLFSNGIEISWSGDNSQTLIGTANSNEIIRITINDSGDFTVTLSGPIDHAQSNVADNETIDITVTAADGTTTSFGNLEISIADDVPTVTESYSVFSITNSNQTVSANVLGPSGSYGGDDGYIKTVKIGGAIFNYDANDNTVTQTGDNSYINNSNFNSSTFVLSITTIKGETLEVNLLSADYTYTASGQANSFANYNVAPIADADDSSLLGIVSANALNFIDLSANQTFAAFDQNNNIESVVIRYAPLLGVGAFTLDASAEIAAELGLQISVVNNPGTIGVLAPSSVLTITALDGGAIDNMPINELLATVILNETGINLDVLNATSITVTDTDGLSDSAIAADLVNANLLGSNAQPSEIIEGNSSNNTIYGNGDDNRIYAFAGDDTINAGSGNDLLRGGVGNDTLNGGTGNDILIGGTGSDQLTGNAGIDMFRWEQGDATGAATDIITDFNTADLASGGDIIDLSSILQGESSLGTDIGNLTNYMHFELSGSDTILYLSIDGSFQGGFNIANVDQQIVFENVDLVSGFDDEAIIVDLLTENKLIVDTPNIAPVANVNDSSLLGIVGANALNLIDLSANQTFTAFDPNNNIESVVINYSPLLGVGAFTLDASAAIAAEFGLQVSVDNYGGVLGVLAPHSIMTITALDGGAIDNMLLNELLATVIINETGINVDVLNATTITVTDTEGLSDSAIAADLANVNLLGSNAQPAEIVEGDNFDNAINANGDDNRIYAFDGDDTVNAGSGNDLIRGGAGTDTLNGNTGNDILMGGTGSDQLTGNTGVDVFRWEQGDAVGSPTDSITDFDTASLANGGDIIDLSSLLQGEGSIGDNPGNLTNYMHFELSGSDTVLYISIDGDFQGGFNLADTNQQIVFENIDLLDGYSGDPGLISALLTEGKLIVDAANSSTNTIGGETTVDFVVSDNDGDTTSTTVDFDSTGDSTPTASDNVAPDVQANDSALLGLIGLSALNLLELGSQYVNAGDRDGNLRSVQIQYHALLGLGAYTLSASTALAAELGLDINIVNDPGILGLVDPSSTLTITALDNGDINNLAINELLGSVEFHDGGSLIDSSLLTLNVLNATTITAEDSEGLTAYDCVASLVDINALDSFDGNQAIQEGTNGDDTLNGTGAHDRLYGFDGNDTLNGLAGNDLLRAGDGDDTLNGGDGNDLLLGGSGNDSMTGGDGRDVFMWENGDAGDAISPAQDHITDFDTNEGDALHLSDLLQDEEGSDLTEYLDFNFDGNDTTIDVSETANGDVTQTIVLDNTDITNAGSLSNQQIIDGLLANNNLITD